MFSMKIYNKNQLDMKELFIYSFFFMYKIDLVAVLRLRLYKLFRVAFLKYEIVDKIQVSAV